jgi:two-component system, NtrC family, sensor kinase
MIDGLQLRSTSVLLWIDGQARQREFLAGHMRETPAPSCEALKRHLARAPERPWILPTASDADHVARREAAALDASLVIPLALGGELLGAFALGRPRSGRSFSRDDVELLHTLAAQTAIAVGNARSYRALQRVNADLEEQVEARTAALGASNAELAQAYDVLKETQTQLVHREKMASLGVLVAGVAHEINNPVSFIVGGLEPLREAVAELRHFATEHPDSDLTPTIERAGRAVEAVARGASRTAEVVKDLRTFSRLGDSRPRPIDLHESIEVTLRLLGSRLGDGITVVREYCDLPPVEAAPGELNQVWMNLLANACDAIAAVGGRGTIRLRTAVVGDLVHVSVRDDGAGMPSHVVSRVFDPFFTTKEQHEGMGLGLSIAHGIVGRHGGRIEVESTLGRGSELTVILPLRQRDGGGALKDSS